MFLFGFKRWPLAAAFATATVAVGAAWAIGGSADVLVYSGFSPAEAVMADVDRDGLPDVVTVYQDSTNQIGPAWLESFGGSPVSFSRAAITDHTAQYNTIAVADFDGDGDVDVVAGSTWTDAVDYFENLGGPLQSWAAASSITASPSCCYSLNAVDLDRDGDMDVVGSDWAGTDTIKWFRNDGPGTWTIKTVASGAVARVRVSDVNLDGWPDLLSGTRIYYNPGPGGGTWTSVAFRMGTANNASRTADFDGDGDIDVVTAKGGGPGDGYVRIYENNGPMLSSWTEHDVNSTGLWLNTAPEIADIDGDGDPDLYGIHYPSGAMYAWWENPGDSLSGWTRRDLFANTTGNNTQALLDLDDDGDVDFLSLAADGLRAVYNSRIHAQPAFAAADPVTTMLSDAYTVAAADFDRDGDVDAAAAGIGSSLYRYERTSGGGGGGGGGPTWTPVELDATSGYTDVYIADLNRDGRDDVVGLNAGTSELYWFENTTDVSWVKRPVASGLTFLRDATLADLDRDGRIDAAVAEPLAGVSWMRNVTDDASTWTTATVDGTVSDANAVDAADIDGDGDLDLIVALSTSGAVTWYTNAAGDASVWNSGGTVASGALTPIDLVPGDFDRDGDVDVVTIGNGDGLRWYANTDGVGGAWTESTIDGTLGSPQYVVARDLDRDGDLDLLVTDFNGSDAIWYENDGAGAWTKRVLAENVSGAVGIEVVDVDNDGDLDVMLANTLGHVSLHLNAPVHLALATTAVAPAIYDAGDYWAAATLDVTHVGREADASAAVSSLTVALYDGMGAPLSASAASGLLTALTWFEDDGDGIYDAGDAVLANVAPVEPDAQGLVTMNVVPAQVWAPGSVTTYVVVTLASEQPAGVTGTFQLATPVAEALAAIEAEDDLPLRAGYDATAVAEISVNAAPTAVTQPVGPLSMDGSFTAVTLAAIDDREDGAAALAVTVASLPTGVSLQAVTNTAGDVVAQVAASPAAADGVNIVELQITDSRGLATLADIAVEAVDAQPEIVAAGSLAITAGEAAVVRTVATVDDLEDAAGDLSVSLVSLGTGLSVTEIDNNGGSVEAQLAADSDVAGAKTFTLAVEDSRGNAVQVSVGLTVTAASDDAAGDDDDDSTGDGDGDGGGDGDDGGAADDNADGDGDDATGGSGDADADGSDNGDTAGGGGCTSAPPGGSADPSLALVLLYGGVLLLRRRV